jgi:hypothetical protein
MAVIHRLAKIPLIPNLMRPKPARPNRLLTLPQSRSRALSFIRRRAPTTEVTFEQSPAFRKISSPLRQLVGWALLRFLDDKDRVLAMPTLLSHQPGHRSKIWDHRLSPLTNATPILFILALPCPTHRRNSTLHTFFIQRFQERMNAQQLNPISFHRCPQFIISPEVIVSRNNDICVSINCRSQHRQIL